ncbi:MAG: hypothetical protein ABJC89_07125 [Acidobacteriota bacterium]
MEAYLGMLLWGGLLLRDPRLRLLVPWRASRDRPSFTSRRS